MTAILLEKIHTERKMAIDKNNSVKRGKDNSVKLEWVDPDFTKLPIEETQAFPLSRAGADLTQAPYS